MINMSNELAIVQRGSQLEDTIRLSMYETIGLLKISYNIQSEVKPYQVTAGRGNKFKELAFLRYILPYNNKIHTEEWLIEFYRLVCSGGRRGYVEKEDSGRFLHLINEGKIPETLCNPLIRGMRFFFLCLWKNKAALLTMNFVLPSTKRDSDPARMIYSELLYAARSPMMKGEVDNDRSLVPHLKHTAYKNVYWYYWRPVVCSDWNVVEDVNNDDLISYFEEISKRNEKGNKGTKYPVSSTGFLGVLYRKYGDRCKFDIGKVSKFNPRAERSEKDLHFEMEVFATNTDFPEQKESWLKLERSYINLLEKQYSKSKLKQAGQSISKLNAYLFTVLPQAGGSPPYPKDFDRRFLDGVEYPCIIDETMVNANLFINLQQFFNHIESVSESYCGAEGFVSPLLKIDKPRDKKRQSTNKKTFTIDDFRFIYEIVYSISEVSWHINSAIAGGVGLSSISSRGMQLADDLSSHTKLSSDIVNVDWHVKGQFTDRETLSIQKKTRSKIFENILYRNSNRSVIDMEEFGYIPFISYQRFSDDKILMVPLRFIPAKVLKVISVKFKSSTRYSPFIAMQYVNQIVAALETGLRHITIRWLDKKTYRHGYVDESKVYFNLHVNSDKVQNSWIRPTSKKLLKVLDRQVESHKWFDDDHVNHEINYNYEKNTRHGKVCPIFIRYDKKEVYGEQVVSNYYNDLMYYVSLVKVAAGEEPLEKISENIKASQFASKRNFECAWKHVKKFKSRFTPHGTRASVVSIMSTVLPADIIGQFITGHVSVDTVRYYISVNVEMMSQMGLIDNEYNENKVKKVLALITPLKIHADSKDSKIRRLLTQGNESISNVMKDFGGCSFSLEINDKYVSGVDEIRRADRSHLAFLPTHICPLENECPRSVKASIGEKQCGQCPYSVKTVDHLPGIQAKCRFLARELDATKKLMRNHKRNNGEGEQSEVIQKKYMRMASELAAWTLTERILRTSYEKLKNKTLVNQPELLKGAVEEREAPSDWLSKLLIECEDAVAYSELANSTLEAHVLRCRSRIVSSKNELVEYYGENDDYDPIEGFRHHVRAFCLATGKSPGELVGFIEKNETKSLLADNFGMSSSNLIPHL